MSSPNWVELGQIAGAHGVRGQVRVRYFGDGPENLLTCEEIWLGTSRNDANARRFEVLSGGTGRAGEARLGLDGIDGREAAQALRGLLVLIGESQLEALPENEFYWHELVGCRAELESGTPVGTVEEIWETGAHDVLVVRDESGRQQLIPTARELLPVIDLEGRRVVIAELPGLVDLSDPVEAEAPRRKSRRGRAGKSANRATNAGQGEETKEGKDREDKAGT